MRYKAVFSATITGVTIGIIGYAKSISLFIINFIVAIVFCFYILADGERLYSAFLGIMPKEYRGIVNRSTRVTWI
jgi:predicted PurR-regulated permease PerM